MMKNPCRKILLPVLWMIALAVPFIAGCNTISWLTYVIAGQGQVKVPAEYANLHDQRIAILITTGPGIEFEYPNARRDIAQAVQNQITEHIENTQFVPQSEIESFQLQNLAWETTPANQLGRQLTASRVLYLDLYQFTMLEENSVHLLRASIRGGLSVYEIDPVAPFSQPVYRTDVVLTHPEDTPRVANPAMLARLQGEAIVLFAHKLTQKFYTHRTAAK